MNAIASVLVRSELQKEEEEAEEKYGSEYVQRLREKNGGKEGGKEGVGGDADEEHPLISQWTFSPEKGNVVFASALVRIASQYLLLHITYLFHSINYHTITLHVCFFDDVSFIYISLLLSLIS